MALTSSSVHPGLAAASTLFAWCLVVTLGTWIAPVLVAPARASANARNASPPPAACTIISLTRFAAFFSLRICAKSPINAPKLCSVIPGKPSSTARTDPATGNK